MKKKTKNDNINLTEFNFPKTMRSSTKYVHTIFEITNIIYTFKKCQTYN